MQVQAEYDISCTVFQHSFDDIGSQKATKRVQNKIDQRQKAMSKDEILTANHLSVIISFRNTLFNFYVNATQI